eukprot:381451_1
MNSFVSAAKFISNTIRSSNKNGSGITRGITSSLAMSTKNISAMKFRLPTVINRANFSTSGSDIMSHFVAKGSDLEGNYIEEAMHSLANADAVCFDVDSTVINEEGIDVLADSLGKG